MRKIKEEKHFRQLAVILIISAAIFLMGADGCSSTLTGGKTSASKYGADFTVMTGADKLSTGKTVLIGDTFFVDVLLENYDKDAKRGEICIRDDIDDSYKGIESECRQFSLPEAIYIGDELQGASSTRIVFPGENGYQYEGMPISQGATLYVSIKYAQHSVITGTVKSPEPETEILTSTLKQLPSPLTVSVEKSISLRGSDSKANLKFGFLKQAGYNISSVDFSSNNIALSTQVGDYTVECPTLKDGFFNVENTRFISCFALLPREQISHPLILNLDYGVRLDKTFGFQIQKE